MNKLHFIYHTPSKRTLTLASKSLFRYPIPSLEKELGNTERKLLTDQTTKSLLRTISHLSWRIMNVEIFNLPLSVFFPSNKVTHNFHNYALLCGWQQHRIRTGQIKEHHVHTQTIFISPFFSSHNLARVSKVTKMRRKYINKN